MNVSLKTFDSVTAMFDQQAFKNDSCRVMSDDGGTVACQEWTFSQTTFTSTIISEWSLVCSNASQIPIVASSYMAGVSTL